MPEIQNNPEFYSPWPLLGKRLNFQWGNERQNTAVSKAIIRAQVQDVETGDDFINADRILSGLEFGELTSNTVSFKNKFRLFYNKTDNTFCIQYNSNTETSPTWVDYLCIDEATGMVTMVGLTVGILGSITAYKHTQASLAAEWIVNHNLNSAAIIVQTFNTRDKVIQFDEADTSDPNTTYFYFFSPQNGSAVILANHGSIPIFEIEETDGTPPAFSSNKIIFDSTYFYLSPDSAGDPIVSFRDNSTVITDHGALSGLSDDDHPQYLLRTETPPAFYEIYFRESDGNPPTFKNDTLIFDSEFFYLSPDSVGKPLVSFRGNSTVITDHGTLSGLSDDDHPQYARKAASQNTFEGIISAEAFYLHGGGEVSKEDNGRLHIHSPSGGLDLHAATDQINIVGPVIHFHVGPEHDQPATMRIRGGRIDTQDGSKMVMAGFYLVGGGEVRSFDFNEDYFYLTPIKTQPSKTLIVNLREDNILVDHVNDFDIHKHVSGFYVIRDPDEGHIDRINWNNGDFNIVNRNVANYITSITGKHYNKIITRDSDNRIIAVSYIKI